MAQSDVVLSWDVNRIGCPWNDDHRPNPAARAGSRVYRRVSGSLENSGSLDIPRWLVPGGIDVSSRTHACALVHRLDSHILQRTCQLALKPAKSSLVARYAMTGIRALWVAWMPGLCSCGFRTFAPYRSAESKTSFTKQTAWEISSSVVKRPKLKRTEASACSPLSPIDRST